MARSDDLHGIYPVSGPAVIGGPVPVGHHEAARLILRTWAALVLTTTQQSARGSCGPVALGTGDLERLTADFGGDIEVEALAEGRVEVTCDVDRYVVHQLVDLVDGPG